MYERAVVEAAVMYSERLLEHSFSFSNSIEEICREFHEPFEGVSKDVPHGSFFWNGRAAKILRVRPKAGATKGMRRRKGARNG
jgi:hypothetical protein